MRWVLALAVVPAVALALAACAEGPGGLSADEAPVTPTEPLEELNPAEETDPEPDVGTPSVEDTTSDEDGAEGDGTTSEDAGADPLGVDDRTLVGTLGGDAELEGGCAWVDTEEGRFELMVVSGARVAFDPLRVVDAEGDVVAEEGDAVQVVGREATDMVSICQVGPIFAATAVLPGTGLLPESPDAGADS